MIDLRPLKIAPFSVLVLGLSLPASAQLSTPPADGTTSQKIEVTNTLKRVRRIVDPVPYWVNSRTLRVRDMPYTGDVVGMLELGQRIEAHEVVDSWIRITENGKQARWVNRDFLTGTPIVESKYGYHNRETLALVRVPEDIDLTQIKIKDFENILIYSGNIEVLNEAKRTVITRHEFRSGPYYERRLVGCDQNGNASHVKVIGEGYTFDMMNIDPRNADMTKELNEGSAINRTGLSETNKAIAAFTCEAK